MSDINNKYKEKIALNKMESDNIQDISDEFLNNFKNYLDFEHIAIRNGCDIMDENTSPEYYTLCRKLTTDQIYHFLCRVFVKDHIDDMLIQLSKDKLINIKSNDIKEFKMETEISIIRLMNENKESIIDCAFKSLAEKANVIINEKFNNYIIHGV